ncbi:hypothetical protein OH76DRAFT_1406776 [Lentinus brumalis]|uniref:Uncharacterized protein n=1 Tax=Lentinus brumalis TaxID=2498619 RepID=A0A371D2E4_9APHY|nr:hypothetical protein OH76DRAFT_1406776 [Polyporus brumalis]
MNGDNIPTLDELLRPSSKRNAKASRQKRLPALDPRREDEDSQPESGLLTPPSSLTQEDDMDASRMLFSPPPEEVLRNVRNSASRARSLPIQQQPFTPSLLADPPAAAPKRKRHPHNRSASHTAVDSIVNDASSSSIVVTEATPNPKPRKQSKRGTPSRQQSELPEEPTTPTRATSQRRGESPTKLSLYVSPHRTNPEADYLPPIPVISRQTVSARRRSTTPIPPYEPPRERFTPPREIVHTPPGATRSPERMTKSSKRKSVTSKNTKKLVLTIKKEPPEIDLSLPPPPPSPSDDPLLLKGKPVQPRKQKLRVEPIAPFAAATSTPTHARQTPSIASSSPGSPESSRLGRIPSLNASMDLSLQDDDDSMDEGFDGPPLFNFNNAQEDSGVWDDSDDSEDDEFDHTGEYTGRFKILTVPTKADPPSSCTRSRQDAWGNPSSPFPGSGGRKRSLPSISSPPLRAVDVETTGSISSSPDEEDVFFLDTPMAADTTKRAEFEEGSSGQTMDDDHTMEVPETLPVESPVRSPSPLPIVDVEDITIEQDTSFHHVRFTAVRDSQEDVSMENEDDSAEGIQPEQDAEMSEEVAAPAENLVADNHYDSDSSDEETVDRELSREPGYYSESDEEERDTRPAPPLFPTPQRPSEPGRSISPQAVSPQAGPSRPRGFLSITSPLRRQKSPQIPATQTWDAFPMPSIDGVLATPTVAAPESTTTNEESPESPRSRVRTQTSEETVVGDQMEEDGAPDADVATDVEDGSGDESEDIDDDVVKITSGDPRVAARAAAILKMHDYDFIIRDPPRKPRHSSVDSVLRKARRKSLMDGGVNKGTPVRRRRTLGGVIGDKVFIPGSPLMTMPQLLHEAERSVEQRERSLHTPSRKESFASDTSFKLPLPVDSPMFETPGPRRAYPRPTFNPSGPRGWGKDDWKLLDACFTDERIALGSNKRIGEATLAPVEDVVLDNVVNRFLDYTGGIPQDECWPGWTREDLLRRTLALQRKQRAGKGAPPTPNGRFGSTALSEVPDFTPLPSRQSSMQPGYGRGESTSSTQSTKPPVPASLLAPRYSHLLNEAIAVSRNESTPSKPVEYRSASVPAPEQRSVSLPPQSPALAQRSESEAPEAGDADTSMEVPQSLAQRSIATRMKGFFWSYLPRATKPAGLKKPAGPAHPGLPIPPPELFQKPRSVSTPASKPIAKPVPPKDLVHLHHAPPPKPSMIPRPVQQKPKRLVELHPAPPPESRPRSSLSTVSDRRSSSGSVRDLVKTFESLEKQQERERIEEAARLRRVKSVGEWAAAAGTRGQAQGKKPGWR